MVKTRRQSGNKPTNDGELDASDAALEDRVPLQLLSPTSRKRHRVDVVDELGTKDKDSNTSGMKTSKRQKLPLRNKEGDYGEIDVYFATEVSVSTIRPSHALSPTGSRHGSSPEQADGGNQAENTRSAFEGLNVLAVGETPQGQADLKRNIEKEDETASSLCSLEKEKAGRRKKALNSQDQKKTLPSHEEARDVSQAFLKPVHKHFDQEQDEEDNFIENEEDLTKGVEESSDDDDAPPDEVDTRDAQGKIFGATRDAAKAAAKRETLVRQKHRERDAKLKDQAKLAQKKRKSPDHGVDNFSDIPGKILATTTDLDRDVSPLPKPDRTEMSSAEETHTLDNDLESNNILATGQMPRSSIAAPYGDLQTKSKFSKSNIPQFLPTEYLEDTPRLPLDYIPQPEQISRSLKKVKLRRAVVKRPKDHAVGSTTYRVSEVGADGMPPRASKIARATKEAWLNGKRLVNGGNRKSATGGFFVNGKTRK